jgi:hypothetical protein
LISSTDDYYLTANKLLVTETTIPVIDINIYKSMKPADNYIPNFMRVNSAVFFSKTGEEWIKNFSHYNSGTYSSQWMVIDYNAFEKLKVGSNKEGVLYILEQTPPDIVHYDITDYLLKHSYFASFNRAFFSETEDDLNLSLLNELYGDVFSRYKSHRRIQFKTLENDVNNLESFKNVLRYNGYKLNHPDDSSNTLPGNAIAARYDLEKGARLSGATDCKIVNLGLMNELSTLAISGPTTENNTNLIPFAWADHQGHGESIIGLPERYEFDWYKFNSRTLSDNSLSDLYKF